MEPVWSHLKLRAQPGFTPANCSGWRQQLCGSGRRFSAVFNPVTVTAEAGARPRRRLLASSRSSLLRADGCGYPGSVDASTVSALVRSVMVSGDDDFRSKRHPGLAGGRPHRHDVMDAPRAQAQAQAQAV